MKSTAKIILVGALALFALAYFIWTSVRNSDYAASMRNWVDHSYQVVGKIKEIEAAITRMESDSRGYLISRDSLFLQATKQNEANINRLLDEIAFLTEDDPRPQLNRLAILRNQVLNKIQFHNRQLFNQGIGLEEIDISPLRSKSMMDDISLNLNQMWVAENELLQIRIAQSKKFIEAGFITSLTGAILALFFIGIILWQLNRDIQRRKTAERDLETFRVRTQAILDNTPLMIQVKDTQGRYLMVNKKLKDTFSMNEEQLIGKTDYDYEPEELAKEYERTDLLAMETGKPVEINETVILHGKTHHFSYTKFPLRDREGNIFGVSGFGIDETEEKNAEEKLKTSEQQMRALLSSTKEGFFMIDSDYRLILMNDAGERILKFSTGQEAKLGDDIRQRLVDMGRKNLLDYFRRVFEGESIEFEQTNDIDGVKRSFLASFIPVKEDGKVVAVTVVARDVTEIVQYRQQLISARKKAEEAEKSQEQFLANISHEIRTPLNGITGMSNLLQRTKLNPEQKEFTNIIKFSSDNLLVLINDILDFSKIKAGKLNIEKIEFNLFDIVQQAVNTLQQKAREKDIGLIIYFHNEVPKTVEGNPYRLNQILSNLLSNAIKFTSQGFIRITISCITQGENSLMRFAIKDTGIGIPEDKLALIFDSFSQASEDVTRKYGGTGLGLTITKQLVELQNGNIKVTSQPGAGTTVSFEILYKRIHREEPASTRDENGEEGTPLEHPQFTGKRVLVVEDNEVNRKVIAYNLEPAGITTTMAHDGKEAVKILEKGEKFDLIIMDLQMPNMNGFQTTVYIRQKLHLDTPIIAMTASALKNEELKCFELGMNEYLTKPFASDDLFRLLDSYFNGKSIDRREAANGKDSAYSLEYISAKRKPSVIVHVLGIILEEVPQLLQEIRTAVMDENWQEVYDKSHKLKSSIGLLQANELLHLLDAIETNSSKRKHLDQLPLMIEIAIEKFNLLKPMLQAEKEEALHSTP